MRDVPTLLEFVTDPQLLNLTVSPAQATLLKSLDGHSLTAEEREIWLQCTGRERYPEGHRFGEATVICGARSGKDSRIAAPLLLYEALFGAHEQSLTRGEHGTLPLVAQDAKGTGVAFGYIEDYALHSPLLKPLVDEPWKSEIRFTNRMRVSCFACTGKSIRGWSIPAAVMDEVAFFRIEGGAGADLSIQTAIRRGGVGFPSPRLIKISTPYGRDGLIWEDFKRYWGVDADNVLVWRAPTTLMNPTITEARLLQERDKDPAAARREYDAEFAESIGTAFEAAWITLALAEHRMAEGTYEPGVRYIAGLDPSGGGAGRTRDAFTLAIVHYDATTGRIVQDVMRGWRGEVGTKLDLGAVCAEVAEVLRTFRLYEVVSDQYGGDWPAQTFLKAGFTRRVSEYDKSEAFRELEPWLSQGRLDLLDVPELGRELRLLEKRLGPKGKTPTIGAPKGAHDDYPNALALAVAELAKSLHPAADIGVMPSYGPRRQLGGAQEPAGVGSGRERTDFWAGRGSGRFWRSGR